jgi:hypothetical protein
VFRIWPLRCDCFLGTSCPYLQSRRSSKQERQYVRWGKGGWDCNYEDMRRLVESSALERLFFAGRKKRGGEIKEKYKKNIR